METIKKISLVFYLLCLCQLVRAQQLITYPAPVNMPPGAMNDDFTVKVRKPGGQWQDLAIYAVQVDMHKPVNSSVAYFDFSGQVEVAITANKTNIKSARIRPISYSFTPEVTGNSLKFSLSEPRNLSIEINDDIFHNLQLFAGPVEQKKPKPKGKNVMYFGPGFHSPGPEVKVPSGTTVYLAGGAVVETKLVCDKVENVRITGRGMLYQAERGIEVTHSKHVEIDGIIVANPKHYTVYGGQSQFLTIRNLKAFSSKGWSDGLDMMSCSDVLIDGVFMRNSDDCIAIYGHRWNYYGDARNIRVQNSSLWADVAHPVNIGTHGNPEKPEIIEDIVFSNLDILNHDEPQIAYQGCFALNASDENLIRNIRFENIRIEDFQQGQLVNLRVTFNKKYAKAPGRGIENILFKNVSYNGNQANISVLSSYNEARAIKGVTFENLKINGKLIRNADQARFSVGEHIDGLVFKVDESTPETKANKQ